MTTKEKCNTKIKYLTHAEAKRARRKRVNAPKLYIYRCDQCGYFHFTSGFYKDLDYVQEQRVNREIKE